MGIKTGIKNQDDHNKCVLDHKLLEIMGYFILWYIFLVYQISEYIPQYGHSQYEKKLGVRDKYHRSIKVHT